MNIIGTHRSAAQRLRLQLSPRLGAGNFFWYARRVATDRNRPIVFHDGTAAHALGSTQVEGYGGLSLNDMRLAIIRHAHWLRTQGTDAGDQVGVQTRDGLLNLLHYIAITSIGAVPVHCNPHMPSDLAADYFLRTGIRVLVGDADLIDACRSSWKEDGLEEHGIVVADAQELHAFAPKPPEPMPDFPHRHADDDLVLISHSSGTTGRPKAPVFSHRSFFAGRWERLWAFPSLRSDRLLSVFPHSHSAGLAHLSMTVLLGLPTLLLDDVSGPSVARAINRFRPSMVFGFPHALAGIPVEEVDPRAAHHIHTWCGMGDSSHESHIRPLIRLGSRIVGGERVPGSDYVDGLGSSEMGMVLFEQVHNAELGVHKRLVGRPSSVVEEAVVLADDGTELPSGQVGRLGVRAPSVSPGYWDDPELTSRSTVGGYFVTGDIVRCDDQGNWYHLDRVPDVITTARGPVYSLPMEEVVLTRTASLDCAVIAVDDPAHADTSVPVALVLTGDDQAPDPGLLLEGCNEGLRAEGLAELHALIVARDRDELPVGPTGKVLKRTLRERHRAVLSADAPVGGAAVARAGDRRGQAADAIGGERS